MLRFLMLCVVVLVSMIFLAPSMVWVLVVLMGIFEGPRLLWKMLRSDFKGFLRK